MRSNSKLFWHSAVRFLLIIAIGASGAGLLLFLSGAINGRLAFTIRL